MVERPFHRIIWIGGDRLVAPEPAHHFPEYLSTLLLAVIADAPGVVDFVALFRQRVHQAHVLEEPVAVGIARTAIVVAPVLHENPERLFVTLCDQFGIDVFTADAGEAADEGDDLAEIVRPEPRHRESGASG